MHPWDQATAGRSAPLAVVDLDAFESNHDDLVRRAGGKPVRVASKSVRVRSLLVAALARSQSGTGPGFRGVLSYAVREALWLADHGMRDLFVAYPSADEPAISRLAGSGAGGTAYVDVVTLAIDSVDHIALIRRACPGVPVRVAVDVDASLRIGPAHLGVRRSPIRTREEAVLVARAAQSAGLNLVGLMFYDAQIAGLPDSSPAVRLVKRRSADDLRARRARIVSALRDLADLEFVNGGGTGSLEITGADPVVTELAAGSGLFAPTLFEGYDAFTATPAAAFALPVVRRPARDVVTLFSGGYLASGPPGWSRVPRVHHPAGLRLIKTEGAGEVQTPVRGRATRRLEVGDRVWLRHAKAGELCERFDEVHLVRGGELVGITPTYRGEGQNFG